MSAVTFAGTCETWVLSPAPHKQTHRCAPVGMCRADFRNAAPVLEAQNHCHRDREPQKDGLAWLVTQEELTRCCGDRWVLIRTSQQRTRSGGISALAGETQAALKPQWRDPGRMGVKAYWDQSNKGQHGALGILGQEQ